MEYAKCEALHIFRILLKIFPPFEVTDALNTWLGPSVSGYLRVKCGGSHFAYDDPIVFAKT